MNKKSLEKYKKLLLKMREEIVAEMDSITKEALNQSQREASGDLSGYAFHMADAATDNYDREFSLNIASDNQKLVYAIDEALNRIKENNITSGHQMIQLEKFCAFIMCGLFEHRKISIVDYYAERI